MRLTIKQGKTSFPEVSCIWIIRPGNLSAVFAAHPLIFADDGYLIRLTMIGNEARNWFDVSNLVLGIKYLKRKASTKF